MDNELNSPPAVDNSGKSAGEKPTRALRRQEVEARTGLSRSTIYDWMGKGDFPKPVKLGSHIVAWREADIEAWLTTREAAG